MPGKILMIAAPASGSGKTILTLGLLRLMLRNKINAASAKAGPDYIDRAFHEAASRKVCFNLDPWAMRETTLIQLTGHQFSHNDYNLIEGVMGLFDGGDASSAMLAIRLNCPILLIVDVRKQAETVVPLIRGLVAHNASLKIAGIILNKVGSTRHETMIRSALSPADPPIIATIPVLPALHFPERHLGLVQSREIAALDERLDCVANELAPHIDLTSFLALFDIDNVLKSTNYSDFPNFFEEARHIAIAKDAAFAFIYPHLLAGWEKAGKQISFFSPLADESAQSADAIFLPGGYPELHAAALSRNRNFMGGVVAAAKMGKPIYGECGGYMVLGRELTDQAGQTFPMLGLLPLLSDFSTPKRHLGYREVTLVSDSPLGLKGSKWRGHEFHHSCIIDEGDGAPLFLAADRDGRDLGVMGRVRNNVMGSYFHFIDRCE